jgi:hypothetical protein
MIPVPSGVRVWIASGHTDMRRGMRSLALTVQESLKRDPHLCVGCKYVAARSLARNFGGDERPLPPRNIQIRSSNCSTVSLGWKRSRCLPEMPALCNPRRRGGGMARDLGSARGSSASVCGS